MYSGVQLRNSLSTKHESIHFVLIILYLPDNFIDCALICLMLLAKTQNVLSPDIRNYNFIKRLIDNINRNIRSSYYFNMKVFLA